MHSRAFVIEGLLAVDPNYPKWCKIADWAINGYKTYKDNSNRLRHGAGTSFLYAGCFAFNNEKTAKEALDFFRSLPQKNKLRLVEEERVANRRVVVEG
jgi:hypothetical protein